MDKNRFCWQTEEWTLPDLFDTPHWQIWTFGWRTARRIQQHLEVRFCYRALVLPSLATLIHCGSWICPRSARRRHFCSWSGSHFRIGRTPWDRAVTAPCTWPLKSTYRQYEGLPVGYKLLKEYISSAVTPNSKKARQCIC